jgi:hypothetical protein
LRLILLPDYKALQLRAMLMGWSNGYLLVLRPYKYQWQMDKKC